MSKVANRVEVDGMPCIQRAGRIWMQDKVAAEYLGRTLSSYHWWVHTNRLTRVKHGQATMSPKEEIDRLSGALKTLSD